MTRTRPLVRVTDLRVTLDGRAVVDGLTLTAHAGRVTAIVGPSGSGKTTTGLALLGELPENAVVEGHVRIDADDVATAVAYIPQHPAEALNPARRVGALLGDIARLHGGPRARVRSRVHDALRLARLPDVQGLLRRFPHQLSGGQQQRVVLAQALLLGARVIVADEPTTGQDAHTKQGIGDRLVALAGEGIAVIMLSHDLDVVRRLADDVFVMHEGRLVESGPPARVLAAPGRVFDRPPTREPFPERIPVPASRAHAEAPSSATRPRLEVRDLVARHRDGGRTITVLHGCDVMVRAGECLALVGRSGSGKTTLGRCVAGLHSTYDGRVLLDGVPLRRSLRSRARTELASVQYVFQDAGAAFDEYRPVADQVARTAVRLCGADPGEARDMARRTLGELGLDTVSAHRRPDRLSGGELQRAALARALLARPRVLVCDEITSGLDATARHTILDLLADLRERTDLTLVFITHDLAAAARLGTRIAVMDAGRIVEQGPARRVLTEPHHAFTRTLLRAAYDERLDNTAAAARDDVPIR